MADTIHTRQPGKTGATLYALVFASDGQIWNGAALEAFAAANYASYAVALTETAGTGYFAAAVPALPAGLYTVQACEQLGGSPAATDPVLAESPPLAWSGSQWVRYPAHFADLAIEAATGHVAANVVSVDGRDVAPTLQSGGTDSVVLAPGEPAVADAYTGYLIEFTGGTGAGQWAIVAGYAADRTATLDRTLGTAVDATTTYNLSNVRAIAERVGALFGAAGTATGTPTAAAVAGDTDLSATDDYYNGAFLVFTSGALDGLSRKISDYAGATRTFAFDGAAGDLDAPFPSAPAAGDTFLILGRG